MRRHLLVAGVLVLLAAALVQPAVAQNETGDNQTAPPEDNETEEEEENETEEDEEPENETEQENETRGPPEDVPGESAQFDARLMTAINTVDALTEIAPNDDVEQRLERALEILRGVQEDTDTASLGHEDHDHNHTEEEEDESQEQQERQGPPEDRGGPPEDRGPSGQRGPQNRGQQGGGPPGFVGSLLGGLFG